MSQTPVKGGNPQGPLDPNATAAAGSMTQTKNLLTKKSRKACIYAIIESAREG